MSSILKTTNIKHVDSASNNLVLGSDGSATINQISSSSVFPAGGTGNPVSVAVICDEKAYNAGGGTFTNGAWRTREFNTEILDADSIVSISSNQFTLIPGTYLIEWSCPAYKVNYHSTVLYDVTASNYITGAMGSSEYTDETFAVVTRSIGFYKVAISSANTYEIRHRSHTTKSSNGFGVDQVTDASSFVKSIYSIAKFTKLK